MLEHGTVIRLYGFVHPPYMLPTFLTSRVFTMEFIRQNLIVETEHFLNFKNCTETKCSWAVGTFTIKNKASLPMIESLLKEMGFLTKLAVNYDPHQVISNIRKSLRRKPFEHEEIVGLVDAINWYDYPKETRKDTDMQEDSKSFVKGITSLNPSTSNLVLAVEKVTPIAICSENSNKRYFSDAMDT